MNEKIKNPAPIEKKQDETRTFGYLKQQIRSVIPEYCAKCDSPVDDLKRSDFNDIR